MSVLDVENLSIHYAGEAVVDGISFVVNPGESVGLVGESGSGKTQTALAILGLLPANAVAGGSIRFDGEELLGMSEQSLDRIRARRISIVFQDPMLALNPYLKIGVQLIRILIAHEICAAAAASARVIAMLEAVGLPDPERQASSYPHQLSGGMRQRAMIASALITEPDLLIADEPTTALDVTVQAQILELLDAIRNRTIPHLETIGNTKIIKVDEPSSISCVRSRYFPKIKRIKPTTAKAPTWVSFMILRISSLLRPPQKASTKSAKPSKCRARVRIVRVASINRACNSGEK